MYTGIYPVTMDTYGRVKIPRKLRDIMEIHDEFRFDIILGFNNNLCFYPREAWTRIQRQIESISPLPPESQDFLRILYGFLHEVTLSEQGRITIPTVLCEMIQAEPDIILIGMMDHLELWNRAEWDAYCAASQGKYREMVAKMLEFESEIMTK